MKMIMTEKRVYILRGARKGRKEPQVLFLKLSDSSSVLEKRVYSLQLGLFLSPVLCGNKNYYCTLSPFFGESIAVM